MPRLETGQAQEPNKSRRSQFLEMCLHESMCAGLRCVLTDNCSVCSNGINLSWLRSTMEKPRNVTKRIPSPLESVKAVQSHPCGKSQRSGLSKSQDAQKCGLSQHAMSRQRRVAVEGRERNVSPDVSQHLLICVLVLLLVHTFTPSANITWKFVCVPQR